VTWVYVLHPVPHGLGEVEHSANYIAFVKKSTAFFVYTKILCPIYLVYLFPISVCVREIFSVRWVGKSPLYSPEYRFCYKDNNLIIPLVSIVLFGFGFSFGSFLWFGRVC
jgi:hypothetical protein